MDGEGFFFQAEDGKRDLVRSRGLGDVYKGQVSPRDASSLRGSDQWAKGVKVPPTDTGVMRVGGSTTPVLSLIHI